jgi:homoserine dehydrogenase
MTMKIGIIGAGSIASCLQSRLLDMGHEPARFLRQTVLLPDGESISRPGTLGQFFAESKRLRPDVMFIAISTQDTGECARDYILDCMRAGARVITCEKGALAYYADMLHQYVVDKRLRFSASVTGGAQALPYLQSRHLNHRQAEVQGVINGTCNFIFDEVARGGRTLGEACQEAIRLGYAEPGASDPLSLINGELRDVAMKTCVLFNTTLARKEFITPKTLGSFQLSADQLEELSTRAASHRLVVSFSNRPTQKHHSFFNGHFETTVNGWRIEGGFRNIRNHEELLSWLPGGVGNDVHIVEGALGSGVCIPSRALAPGMNRRPLQ